MKGIALAIILALSLSTSAEKIRYPYYNHGSYRPHNRCPMQQAYGSREPGKNHQDTAGRKGEVSHRTDAPDEEGRQG